MKSLDLIVVGSIPHMGTYFLRDLITDVMLRDNVIEFPALVKSHTMCRLKVKNSSDAWEGGLSFDKRNLVLGHFEAKGDAPKVLQAFAMIHPFVMPWRDPLAAIISTHIRKPNESAANVFRSLARFRDGILPALDHYHPLVVPVDLMAGDRGSRFDRMYKIMRSTWRAFEFDRLEDWCIRWPVVNGSDGGHELKLAYNAGDIKALMGNGPVLRQDIELLRREENWIVPLMFSLGYSDPPFWVSNVVGSSRQNNPVASQAAQ